MTLRQLALAASPGVLALALATIALLDADGDSISGPAAGAPAAAEQSSAEPSFADLYDRVDGAVARVDARRGPDDPPFGNGRRVATGAAWLVDDDGHLVTNAHVVDRARSVSLRFGRSARRLDARIIGRDPRPTSRFYALIRPACAASVHSRSPNPA